MVNISPRIQFVGKQNKVCKFVDNWKRTRSDKYKMLRARRRKKYIDRTRKREINKKKYARVPMEAHFKKNIDEVPLDNIDMNTTPQTTTTPTSVSTEPPRKKSKLSCPNCGKSYTYKTSYDKHVVEPYRCKKRSQ